MCKVAEGQCSQNRPHLVRPPAPAFSRATLVVLDVVRRHMRSEERCQLAEGLRIILASSDLDTQIDTVED